jgi:prolyl 4-hydroxylase
VQARRAIPREARLTQRRPAPPLRPPLRPPCSAFLYRAFLSPAEVAHLRALAAPRLRGSVVTDPLTFKPLRAAGTRSSSGAFLRTAETPSLAAVEARVAAWTQIPASHQEPMHVLRYARGQHYGDHSDAFDEQTLQVDPFRNSQRVATVLMYLAQAREGRMRARGAWCLPR